MKLLLPLLLLGYSVFGQTTCDDFLILMGQRDINENIQSYQKLCGPFSEVIAQDGMSKTWTNDEKGIKLVFANHAKDKFALPQFELMSIELSAFTNEGGFTGTWPFGFKLGMDAKMVKSHIMQLKSVDFEKRDLSKKFSSFTYTGAPNSALQNRQIRVYISQFDGKTITSMRLRLK